MQRQDHQFDAQRAVGHRGRTDSDPLDFCYSLIEAIRQALSTRDPYCSTRGSRTITVVPPLSWLKISM